MVTIEQKTCIGCGQCVKDCVSGVLYLENGKANLKNTGCIDCGHCYAICPVGAVSVPGLNTDAGELVSMSEFDSTRLLQAMKSRRTIRQFRPDAVEAEKIQMILEAGRYCPTGTNSQDVAYTILGSRQDEIEQICINMFRKSVSAAGMFSDFLKNMNIDDHFFFKGAPLVIVVSGKSGTNAALASSYMELMAESLGLGVLYSGFFVACSKLSAKVRGILNLPAGHKVITCLVIGYPNVKYHRIPGRKPLNVRTL